MTKEELIWKYELALTDAEYSLRKIPSNTDDAPREMEAVVRGANLIREILKALQKEIADGRTVDRMVGTVRSFDFYFPPVFGASVVVDPKDSTKRTENETR